MSVTQSVHDLSSQIAKHSKDPDVVKFALRVSEITNYSNLSEWESDIGAAYHYNAKSIEMCLVKEVADIAMDQMYGALNSVEAMQHFIVVCSIAHNSGLTDPKYNPTMCQQYDFEKWGEVMPVKQWCIEFWDFGKWNEFDGTRHHHKQQCVDIAQKWNREMSHEGRQSFEGHRFRVRRAKD